GFQQLARDLVGIRIKETHPAQFGNSSHALQQQRQSVLQPKVFAVTGGVLADERNLAYSVPRQPLSFRNHGFKASRTKFAPQLRDDAEAARMITAFGNLDVRRCFRRRKHARRVFVIEVIRQIGNSAVPFRAGKASALLARQPFRPSWYAELQLRMTNGELFPAGLKPVSIPAAARICSSSPVPTTASTSGIFFCISSR